MQNANLKQLYSYLELLRKSISSKSILGNSTLIKVCSFKVNIVGLQRKSVNYSLHYLKKTHFTFDF